MDSLDNAPATDSHASLSAYLNDQRFRRQVLQLLIEPHDYAQADASTTPPAGQNSSAWTYKN